MQNPVPQRKTASRVLLLCVLCLTAYSLLADEVVPPGPFAETECIGCHAEKDPQLISQWQNDPHSTAADTGCTGCHGDRHENATARARKDLGCTGCHSGPVSHSYATSKHGIITRIEESRRDWQIPLQSGNYRTPGCSYCHYYDGSHSDTMAPDAGPGEVRQWICIGCHSPRYVNEQFASGKRQLAIAALKVNEGRGLASAAAYIDSGVLKMLLQDLTRHRQNVFLGIGHQSPDYQWWHGQPALDGDLIRIRDALTGVHKQK
jgi:hypothetical protein